MRKPAENNSGEPFILSFDLGDEVFQTILLPKGMVNRATDINTSVFGGSLSLLCYNGFKRSSCSIWIMKDYGVVDSWYNPFKVDLNVEFLRVISLRDNGHILLEGKTPTEWELSSYDPCSQQVKNLGIQGAFPHFHVDTFEENLVLLNKKDAVSRRGVSRKRKDSSVRGTETNQYNPLTCIVDHGVHGDEAVAFGQMWKRTVLMRQWLLARIGAKSDAASLTQQEELRALRAAKAEMIRSLVEERERYIEERDRYIEERRRLTEETEARQRFLEEQQRQIDLCQGMVTQIVQEHRGEERQRHIDLLQSMMTKLMQERHVWESSSTEDRRPTLRSCSIALLAVVSSPFFISPLFRQDTRRFLLLRVTGLFNGKVRSWQQVEWKWRRMEPWLLVSKAVCEDRNGDFSAVLYEIWECEGLTAVWSSYMSSGGDGFAVQAVGFAAGGVLSWCGDRHCG
ncbi:hypothetical protein RHSIM_Rhsim02G0168100 [Rhododendron simsii]|uniref:F-box associated domain-containing protein n=1 Tax=Rhododendron simsii TaxID=118357 RepID=A0A834HB86_RHOSS|nr:hypothetical protein RHSIM_Rhsim02G0168100 [Rhododendron simsii]